ETKTTDDLFPMDEIREHGYHAALYGQKTYNGVAIVSREPVTDVARGFSDGEPDDDARLIAATYHGVRVLSVYVPNGKEVGCDRYVYKLAWMKRRRAYLERHHQADDLVVVAGEFNVSPEDRDVWDPPGLAGQLLCSEPERAALAHLVDWGLVDGLRLHHGDAGLYSWWDYRMLGFPKNRGLRIDMVYVSRGLASRCVTAS